ncbi:unnamed protein product [marine sediment metagenome]|uniref:Methyltransferase FkbM domain-containing protein n=1 Tax=marine sediment metagenome TaxID=412755 RepID=X1L1W6_9ZZZZ
MCNTATVGSWIGDDYKAEYQRGMREKDGRPHQLYTIKCMTMDSLIKDHSQFADADLVSIDIESNEDKLLAKCDFSIFKPTLIIIESALRNKDQKFRWQHFLSPYYDEKETYCSNTFYLRK